VETDLLRDKREAFAWKDHQAGRWDDDPIPFDRIMI
jgi:hypothetical protein